MSLDQFGAMIDILSRVSTTTIDIMGGEPTMHSDIVRLIADALQRGFSVNVSSNGSNLGVLEEIMGFGSLVSLGLSVNDRVTLDQVRNFVLKYKPIVKTVFQQGLDYGMIRDILALGPKRFYLIYRDTLHRDELHTSVPFPWFLSEVERHFDHGQVGMVYCSGFLPDTAELGKVRCPAGTTKLGVMPDGAVYPCNLFFGEKEFLLGNLSTDPFDVIWNHRVLDFFRRENAHACTKSSCPIHGRCHGGCPAHGLLVLGDLAAPDPRCHR